MATRRRTPRRDVTLVALLTTLGIALTAGWLLSGRASAPDGGLLQLDVLSLHEQVPGVGPVGGRPTMVVLAGLCPHVGRSRLPARYGVVVHRPSEPSYAALARALALPLAARHCRPGYVLVDRAGVVRYRSYDPGWAIHAAEQSILLDAL